jgi:hypothetical protein
VGIIGEHNKLFVLINLLYICMSKNNFTNIDLDKDTLKYGSLCILSILVLVYFYIILPILHSRATVHVLFTRYKEPDMSDLLKPFINKKNITVFIYNKGEDTPSGIPNGATNIKIINIPNLGWDSYGYIYHIINNYKKLPTYIANLHASAQYLQHKYQLYLDIVNYIENIDTNRIKYYGGKIDTTPLHFRLENWIATLDVNKQTNNKYTQSNIYPLNTWLESKINTISDKVKNGDGQLKCNYFGQFIVHRSRILRYPLSFYKNILEEISVWQSEVNHYLERSWYTFYGEE